ncbi:unnamed protein product [Linum tenue]|uniref:Uncharacterized protein n=1 Tax=Linum tenue TaxID=586396 RepID=A0AAV0J9X0_9ROSI|nr:unnamed protein product [Linum tenue]
MQWALGSLLFLLPKFQAITLLVSQLFALTMIHGVSTHSTLTLMLPRFSQ